MVVKYLCRRCGEQVGNGMLAMSSNVTCPKCGKVTSLDLADERYFPETPGNKVFAVDVYVPVCKCVKVEAADEDAAIEAVEKYMDGLCRPRLDREFIVKLAQEGFQDAEEQETHVSGEAGEDGNIEYY